MNQIAIRNFCVGGKEVPAVTSLQIADSFCKNHKDVLRDIRVIIEKCSLEFTERNFALSEYGDSTGTQASHVRSFQRRIHDGSYGV